MCERERVSLLCLNHLVRESVISFSRQIILTWEIHVNMLVMHIISELDLRYDFESVVCQSKISMCSYPIWKSISGKNWPGSPVCVMLISGVHMLSEAIDIMRWKFSRQLYVLVCKHQRSHAGVKPERVQGKKKQGSLL